MKKLISILIVTLTLAGIPTVFAAKSDTVEFTVHLSALSESKVRATVTAKNFESVGGVVLKLDYPKENAAAEEASVKSPLADATASLSQNQQNILLIWEKNGSTNSTDSSVLSADFNVEKAKFAYSQIKVSISELYQDDLALTNLNYKITYQPEDNVFVKTDIIAIFLLIAAAVFVALLAVLVFVFRKRITLLFRKRGENR